MMMVVVDDVDDDDDDDDDDLQMFLGKLLPCLVIARILILIQCQRLKRKPSDQACDG